jgi:hypothetical protein
MTITRDQAWGNSYLWPDGTVPYSQVTGNPRHDCSGYVGGLCWSIPVQSINTVSLVTDGWMYEIPAGELKVADAIGKCGPGTAGNAGHIMLFGYWSPTGLYIAEQAGGPPGPRHRLIKSIPVGYKAYRFRDITGPDEDEDEDEDEDDMTPAQNDLLDNLAWRMDAIYADLPQTRKPGAPSEPNMLHARLVAIEASIDALALASGLDPAALKALVRESVRVELNATKLTGV